MAIISFNYYTLRYSEMVRKLVVKLSLHWKALRDIIESIR